MTRVGRGGARRGETPGVGEQCVGFGGWRGLSRSEVYERNGWGGNSYSGYSDGFFAIENAPRYAWILLYKCNVLFRTSRDLFTGNVSDWARENPMNIIPYRRSTRVLRRPASCPSPSLYLPGLSGITKLVSWP